MRRPAIAALVLAAIALPQGAKAQTLKECFEATTRTDDQAIIRICSQALDRGQLNQADRSVALSNRGLGYLRNKEYDRSIIDFSDALLIDPRNPYAFNSRGDAWLQKSNFARAFADFDESLRIDAAFTGALYNRGLAFERQGNANAARAEYRKAVATTGERALDKWARDRAQERLTSLGDSPRQPEKQAPRDDTRRTPDREDPGRGSDGSYKRRLN